MNNQKLKQLKHQYDELLQRVQEPGTWQDPSMYARCQKEMQELAPIAEAYTAWERTREQLDEVEEMLKDPELHDMAWEEKQLLLKNLEDQEHALQLLLIPKDPNDGKNVIMEIRAGVGGEEGALFASDLYRMYALYAETRHWKIELVNLNETELGGMKEISFIVEGANAFSRLKFEGGGHRVQRVPITESGGRIHTSAATVAVLPQLEEVDFHLNMNELRLIPIPLPGPADSTSTRRKVQYASHICRAVLLLNARMSEASIRTKTVRCPLCVQSSMNVSWKSSMRHLTLNGKSRSEAEIGAIEFARIISHRTVLQIIV